MDAVTAGRISIGFNNDWLFCREDKEGAYDSNFIDNSWEKVNLPHTPRIEEKDVCMHFQGLCWYRKWFTVDEGFKGKKIFIEFEGAMHTAEVWVNGKYMTTHKGGYLPFSIDITEYIYFDKENLIALRLDNRDNGDIPPGKPLDKLDFSYFGGIYRNVHIHIMDKLHITDPVYADKMAGGGVFVTYPFVSKDRAKIQLKTHVVNENIDDEKVCVVASLIDSEGNIIATSNSDTKTIGGGEDHTFIQDIEIHNPRLWMPHSPYLYRLKTYVKAEDDIRDGVETGIGIRRIEVKKPEGFLINGEPIRLRGVNRHQQYPYIGNAASDNAQYRDAKKLKEAGFNFVRLGHYPQSPAFLDACDELGLMAVEPTPGWQWCKEGEFQELVKQNIRDMIRRDRNHPCIIMWETSLNETGTYWEGAGDEFYKECNEIAHEEYPGDQMLTSGDTMGRDNPEYVGYDVPYTLWDEENKSRPLDILPNKMGLHREYGDFEFGGAYSTTRRQRSEGERALLDQAWNFQWSHNKNNRDEWSIGDAIWVGIDYNRGLGVDDPRPTCDAGILDTFRIPKFSYYFFQSQRYSNIKSHGAGTGPMVYIANYWSKDSDTDKVVIYSNCEEIRLYINDRLIAIGEPDRGPYAEYIGLDDGTTVDYWLKGGDIPKKKDGGEIDDPLALFTLMTKFDGGNCRNLAYSPFTFKGVIFEPGELKAIGLIEGKEVAKAIRKTPKAPKGIAIEFDISGRELAADGGDFIFVYAKVIDEDGTVIQNASNEIEFRVEGKGRLIGQNPVKAEAGIASILLGSMNEPGKITVSAQGGELKVDSKTIISKAGKP